MPATPGTTGHRVLVVDDTRSVADTLVLILRRHGYECSAAYNGDEALEYARERSPDLLLSDVVMRPGIDGFQLARVFSVCFPECRILLYTANPEAVHSTRFRILEKPLGIEQLVREVRVALQGRSDASGLAS